MKILFNKKMLLHNQGSEVEGPYRLSKLSDIVPDSKPDTNGSRAILTVHSKEYVDLIKEASRRNEHMAEVDTTRETYLSAVLGVGLSVDAALSNNFAAVRPPGHHAAANRASGFCFFNNMAIAALHLANKGSRVLVIDVDGHHGDGTQEILNEKGYYRNTMYSSVDQENAWPQTIRHSGITHKNGKATSVNILVPKGAADDLLITSVDLILHASMEFRPDVIGVSLGVDGHRDDKLLKLRYTERGFYELGRMLKKSGTKIFGILEGGYHDRVVECILGFVSGVNGDEFPYDMLHSVSDERTRNRFNYLINPLRESLRRGR